MGYPEIVQKYSNMLEEVNNRHDLAVKIFEKTDIDLKYIDAQNVQYFELRTFIELCKAVHSGDYTKVDEFLDLAKRCTE